MDALVDSGCDCYSAVNEPLARSLKLPRIPITPRTLKEAVSEQGVIKEMTYLEVDLDGYKHRIWAYIIPKLSHPIILGKPWMEREEVTYVAHKHLLSIGRAGDHHVWEKHHAPATKTNISRVSINAIKAEARRGRRSETATTQLFAVTLADINRALAPKKDVSVDERLPPRFKAWKETFDKKKGETLPPHREGADHEINIVTDENGNTLEVPWGPLYGMSRDELLILRKTLTELLDQGYIRASSSSAGAPVIFVKKPGGGLRFCVDYRALNSITRADRYPLPLIKETLSSISKAKWFTKLDVRAAFHKLRIKEGDEWKTAFRTRFGLFEWLVTPFGLCGAPATFQRYINSALRPFLDISCSAYLDDVLIYSDGTKEDHDNKVEQILSALSAAGLNLDISKCEFGVRKTKYLGYIIEAGVGVSMDPEKLLAIRDWEAPKSLKGVRSFLGFANFYRQFIEAYSAIAEPLLALTKKGTPFRWGGREEAAFEQLKNKFISEPALAQWDPERETTLEADCSGYSLGGCLSQRDEQGLLRPVAYHSRRLTAAECNYVIHDKELLAIVDCLRVWDAELRGTAGAFIIYSDHKNLSYFMAIRRLTERQVRWSEELSRFRFRLVYREGAAMQRPDALSRREQDMPQGMTDERLVGRDIQLIRDEWVAPERRSPINISRVMIQGVELPQGAEVFMHEDLQSAWDAALEHDTDYPRLVKAVRDGARAFPPDIRTAEGKQLSVSIAECELDEHGLLRFRDNIWIPEWEPLRTGLIQNTHDSFLTGHPGRDATIALLSRSYFWPGLYRMVRRFVRNCDVCGRKTVWRHRKKGLLKPLPVPERLWSELSIDFMINLPQENASDPSYLMVITDRLGKGVTLEPMTSMEASACAERFINSHWRFHGFPRAITSDRGTNWVGGFWRRLCELTGIEQRLSTAYHPETDGATERANQEVLDYLRAFVTYAQYDWAQLLPGAQLAINNRDTSTIGLSPFFIEHGYHADPIPHVERSVAPAQSPRVRAENLVERLREATSFAQAAMAATQQRMEASANERRDPAERFEVGDEVWLSLKNIPTDRPSHKLAWLHNKYTVKRVIDSHTVELDVPDGRHPRFHVDLLLRAARDPLPSQQARDYQPQAVIPETEEEAEEHLVESILRARNEPRKGRRRAGETPDRQVLVKWVGWEQPDWQPLENFQETEALERFENRYGSALHNNGPPPRSRRRAPNSQNGTRAS